MNSISSESHSFFSRSRPWHESLTVQKQTSLLLEKELRSTISFPRAVPRPLREKIAEILVFEILFGKPYEIKDPDKFIRHFGGFYPIYLALKNSKPWPKLRQISKKSQKAGVACMKLFLPLIYSLMERIAAGDSEPSAGTFKELNAKMEVILREFEKILKETLLLWRKSTSNELSGKFQDPDKNPEQSEIYGNIIDLMQMEGYQAFLESRMEELYLRMQEFISEMEENLDLFETLALLFPERNWTYSIKELKKEPFYLQLKMLKNYSAFFEKSPDLRRIVDFIGRREFDPPANRIRFSPFGKNRIQTVRFSDSINNLLPIEAEKLLNPSLKRKFYADMHEGKLLSYQLLGKHYTGPPRIKPRGPMIVLVDTSGSMHGAPQTLAKASVLAMAKRMLSQQRDMKVILFASTSQHLEIELSSKKKMPEKFLNFLLYTFGGGTDFNTALASGLKSLKEKDFQGADLFFITDGKSQVSDELVLARWEEAKKKYNAKVYSLIVGSSGAGGLSEISDYTYFVEMELDSEGTGGFVRLIELNKKE